MAGKPWSVQAVIASLEKQAAVHRELEAQHAEKEAFHREQRSTHAAELEAITTRLKEFQAAAAAAIDLADRDPSRPASEAEEDFGSASRPHLGKMVRRVLTDLGPDRACGATWVTQELNRRFGDRLRRQVSLRQVSAILRRLHRQGELDLRRRGKPHHEARYSAR